MLHFVYINPYSAWHRCSIIFTRHLLVYSGMLQAHSYTRILQVYDYPTHANAINNKYDLITIVVINSTSHCLQLFLRKTLYLLSLRNCNRMTHTESLLETASNGKFRLHVTTNDTFILPLCFIIRYSHCNLPVRLLRKYF